MSKFRAHRSLLAFSLMELLIALFVFSIVTTVAWSLTGLAYRTENYFDRVLSQRVNFENAMSLLRSDLSNAGKPIMMPRRNYFLKSMLFHPLLSNSVWRKSGGSFRRKA